MASAKVQKPAKETGAHSHEEHKFGQKISEMTAKVFGHKQQENHEMAKHCTTCKCPAAVQKDMKTSPGKTQKDGKHSSTNCIELKKKEKNHVGVTPTKETKAGHNYLSSMTEHLKENIMMKKSKDEKSSDSDSSSDDESSGNKKQKNKMHANETKHASK